MLDIDHDGARDPRVSNVRSARGRDAMLQAV
jgi:hypothetical protein